MEKCTSKERIEKVEEFVNGENGEVGAKIRIFRLEKDLYGNGVPGVLDKTNKMWQRDLMYQEEERKKTIRWGNVFQIILSILSSGLSLYVVQVLSKLIDK